MLRASRVLGILSIAIPINDESIDRHPLQGVGVDRTGPGRCGISNFTIFPHRTSKNFSISNAKLLISTDYLL